MELWTLRVAEHHRHGQKEGNLVMTDDTEKPEEDGHWLSEPSAHQVLPAPSQDGGSGCVIDVVGQLQQDPTVEKELPECTRAFPPSEGHRKKKSSYSQVMGVGRKDVRPSLQDGRVAAIV